MVHESFVELCRETRGENGGLLGVEECRKRVGRGKAIGGGLEVSKYAALPLDPSNKHHSLT